MISYGLAKELKDAGFPQEPFWIVDVSAWGGSWYYLDRGGCCATEVFSDPDQYKKGVERGDALVKLPTLSELIEVCGWRFVNLGKSLGEKNDWYACSGGHYDKDSSEIRYDLLLPGATPEEAVARLYLALHQK